MSSIKITVEYSRNLDMDARESVTISRNVSFYDDEPPIEKLQEALDKFREHIDASERIPVA